MSARRHLAADLGASLPALPVDTRPPGLDDLESLAALMLEAYAGSVDATGDETLEDARTEVRGYLAGNAGAPLLDASLLALADGVPVSALLLSRLDGDPFVAYAYTSHAHAGRGLASTLLATAMTHLAEVGERRIHLWVTAGNVPAERIYARLGFRDVER